MTLAELKTKTLAEILQEKDLCLVVLQEDAFAKIQDNLGRLSDERQSYLKNLIIEGLRQMLLLQEKAKIDLEKATASAINDISILYQSAFNTIERNNIKEDQKRADDLITNI